MIDRGEALLAVIGIKPVLDRSLKHITVDQFAAARVIEPKIRMLAARLVNGTLEENSDYDPAEYDGLLVSLTEAPTPAELAKMIGAFPAEDHDDAGAFLGAAGRAYSYLQGQFPVSVEQRLIGVVNRPPNSVALTTFGFVFEALNEPLEVFQWMQSGCLLGCQVRALRAVYPTIHAGIVGAIADRVTDETMKHPGYEPPFALALSTLAGAPYVAQNTTRAIGAAQDAKAQALETQRQQQPKESRVAQMTATPARNRP